LTEPSIELRRFMVGADVPNLDDHLPG
jgi:hypothetical protein